MSENDEVDWENYESGPFCRCWGELGTCENECSRCGHFCRQHGGGYDDGYDMDGCKCDVDGCKCEGWKE